MLRDERMQLCDVLQLRRCPRSEITQYAEDALHIAALRLLLPELQRQGCNDGGRKPDGCILLLLLSSASTRCTCSRTASAATATSGGAWPLSSAPLTRSGTASLRVECLVAAPGCGTGRRWWRIRVARLLFCS